MRNIKYNAPGGDVPVEGSPKRKPMSTWKKIGLGAAAAMVLAAGIWLIVWQIQQRRRRRSTTDVVARQDLTSVVTAASGRGQTTHLHECAWGGALRKKLPKSRRERGRSTSRKGDVLLRLEVSSPRRTSTRNAPTFQSADAGIKSAEANDVSTQADIKSRAADLEHAKLDWERGQELFKDSLIPKQDYDTRKGGVRQRCGGFGPRSARRAGQSSTWPGAVRTDPEQGDVEPADRRPPQDHVYRSN